MCLAEVSKGAKRKIYLEYAADLFQEIRQESNFEECTLSLSSVLLQQGRENEAKDLYLDVIQKCQSNKVTKSYYLSKSWMELGKWHRKQGQAKKALDAFEQAELAGSDKLLSGDQLLDLQIQKSDCLRAMGDPSAAMKVLSDVVNAKIVSQKRLEAMYLRAEIYEQQGRPELAKRQLETLAGKGGPWAKKAQETLDEHYVF